MTSTRFAPTTDSHVAIDALARALDSHLQRRRIFGLLAATFASGILATTTLSQEAVARSKRRKGKKKRGKHNGTKDTNDQGTPIRTCTAAADCGTDIDGSMCACRENAATQKICTKINGRFLANGTCADCQGEEQCIPVVSGGIECIPPCGAP